MTITLLLATLGNSILDYQRKEGSGGLFWVFMLKKDPGFARITP
jgi:hypothetical protein